MAKKIDWNGLAESFCKFCDSDQGLPILPLRLMIGLLLLKYIYDLSDEEVVAQWQENMYHQAFTGQELFVMKAPCNSSQLSQFRKRITDEGCQLLFAESVRVHGPKALESSCLVDTTVQEKNISFPTDCKLMLRAIAMLLRIGSFLSIKFRSAFKRKTKRIRSEMNFSKSKLDPDRKTKLIERLGTIGLSLLTTMRKNLSDDALKCYKIISLLLILNKIFTQRKGDANKVYSIHEPQTMMYCQGKVA